MRGEQNNILFPVFAFDGIPFSKFKPFCAAFGLGALAGYRAQTSGAKSS